MTTGSNKQGKRSRLSLYGHCLSFFHWAFGAPLSKDAGTQSHASTVPQSQIMLSLVPTDDLILEIQSRYDVMVFMSMKVDNIATNGKLDWSTKRRYKGNPFMCSGLASNMLHFFNELVAVTEKPADGQGT